MTASMPPSRTASVSDLLETSTAVFRATLLKCLPLGMVAVCAAQLPNFYWIASGHELRWKVPDDATYRVLGAIGWVIELLLLAALMLRQRAMIAGRPLHAAVELRAALQCLPALILTALLAILSIAAGLLLLVIPGLFLSVCYLLLMPVVLFERHTPYGALLRSVQLARPLWWKICAAEVIAIIVVVICALVFAAVVSIAAAAVSGQSAAFSAIEAATMVGLQAVVLVFLSALALVLHSAASSSA